MAQSAHERLTDTYSAAKQAAFEEQNRIKNQFRPLDDDEIDFLDEVRESKRAEEERVRRETEEGLAAFRKAQNQKRPVDDSEAGEGDATATTGAAEGTGADEEWTVGPRKRRKGKEGRGFGVKREKSSGEGEKAAEKATEKKEVTEEKKVVEEKKAAEVVKEAPKGSPPAPAKPKFGLVAYGSDSDDD